MTKISFRPTCKLLCLQILTIKWKHNKNIIAGILITLTNWQQYEIQKKTNYIRYNRPNNNLLALMQM